MIETFFGKMLFVFDLFTLAHVPSAYMEVVKIMTDTTVSYQGPSTNTRSMF